MKNFQQRFIFKTSVILLLVIFVISPFKAQATPDTTLAVLAQTASEVGRWIKDNATILYEKVIKRAGNIAFKNALRTFMSQVAYDTATRLVEGDWGKSPMFNTENFGNFLEGVAETTLVDTLDVLGKDNGFLEFDVCNPEALDFKATLTMGLFDSFTEGKARTQPRCSWQQIANNWDEWVATTGRNLSSEQFLKNIQDSFSPNNSQIGTYLTIKGNVAEKLAIGKEVAALNRVATKGMKDITSPISGFIKTPAVVSETAVAQLADSSAISQPELVSTGDILADALGIFTNTLASKLMKKLFDQGLADVTASRDIFVYNWATAKTYNAGESLASLVSVNFSSGLERVLEPMSQCPDPENPGPLNCVIPPSVVTAIEQKMTVREAVNKGFITGGGFFGFKKSGDSAMVMDYLNGLPYRSLVILRAQRIIPVTWEIAALYWQEYITDKNKQLTLNYLLDCFEDPNNPDDNKKPTDCVDGDLGFNPYYHLVDPNWVLKAPESYCEKKGSGYLLASSRFACTENNVAGTTMKVTAGGMNLPADTGEILYPACDASLFDNPDVPVLTVQRDDQYCADRKSCLKEDASGRCLSYGYCLKEESVWRLPGKTCEAQYDTCETFTRTSDRNSFSYLRNTLEECSSQDGGCWWYSTVKKASYQTAVLDREGKQVVEDGKPVFEWQSDWSDQDRIYLNGKTETCNSRDAGCTKLSRMLPGINLVFNGDFSNREQSYLLSPVIGWDSDCAQMGDGFLTLSAGCSVTTSGQIPVDSNFTYVLSADLNGSGNIKLNGTNYNSAQLGQGVDVKFSASVKQVKLEIVANANAEFSMTADNIQLLIKESPIASHNKDDFNLNVRNYKLDYSQDSNYARQYLKIAPSYFGCSGYNQIVNKSKAECEKSGSNFWREDIGRCVLSGSLECSNFATECKQSEVGCQSFTPVEGGVAITGTPREADYCPDKCVGYDSYLEKPTKFANYSVGGEAVGKMVNFIPKTATTCSAVNAGCEEFTNLDSSTSGGESLEYFTDFRQCVPKENTSIVSYYTWEGSDTAGYQLKKWEFLKTNLQTGAPCVNLVLGSSTCADSSTNITDKYCSADDFKAGNQNCREFFNSAGTKFYILQDKPIVASDQCRAYRRTIDNNIWNVDLNLSKRCSASVNGCREYKGNQSNNQKIIFNDTFEDGTISGWSTGGSAFSSSVLEYSTEALNQGGHSLKIKNINSSIYRDITLTAGNAKEYQLLFWAKKEVDNQPQATSFVPAKGLGLVPTAHAQADVVATGDTDFDNSSATLTFDFDGNQLSTEWQLFTTAKITLTPDQANSAVALNLKNLSNKTVYLDNIVLKESADIFYVIKDSWQTNAKCDDPFIGAQLGCKQYKDRGNNNYYLKSLNSLCSASAIGCEAYINTQNSTIQSEQVQQSGICSEKTGGVVKQYGTAENDDRKCYINDRLMCKMPSATATECSYMKDWTVPNDNLIYLVNDKNKECSAKAQGCSQVGKPAFDRNLENYLEKTSGLDQVDFVKDYQDIYLINNPDKYYETACSENGLFCTAFKGELSGEKYFYDPRGYKDGEGNDFSRTCYFRDGKWWETNSNPAKLCDNRSNFKMLASTEEGYNGWVGLCSAESSTCTEIRDPKTAKQEGVVKCDAQISPYLAGVCGDGPDEKIVKEGNDTEYCQKTINNFNYYVCQVEEGEKNCNYTAYDWKCFDDSDRDNNRACKINGIKVCDIEVGKTSCSYSLVCKSDYYLKNTLTEGQGACKGGNINDEAGCMLFYDSSKIGGSYSAYATVKNTAPANCDEKQSFGNENYCNANSYYGVTRDRQCAEWLECGSAMLTTAGQKQQEVCSGLARCLEADKEGKCIKIASADQSVDINLTNDDQNQVESLRYLSGFSKPTINWISNVRSSDNKSIDGRKSPETMSQIGEKIKIVNGGFELNNGSLDDPQGWQIPPDALRNDPYLNRLCQASLDEKDSHSGRYSLKITSDVYNNQVGCFYESTGGDNGYYPIKEGEDYVLSFYAKSLTGGEKLRAVIQCSNNESIKESDIFIPPTKELWGKFVFKYNFTDCDTGNMKIAFKAHSTNITWGEYHPGTVWIDDVAIEPVLDPTGKENFVSKDCRLYPNAESLSCSYETDKIYRGWNGYCLEPDPFYQNDPTNPNDYQKCLQWYPLDALKGDSADVFSAENNPNVVYTGPRPLYYCLNSLSNKDVMRRSYEYENEPASYEKNFWYPHDGMFAFGVEGVLIKENPMYIDDLAGVRFSVSKSHLGEPWPIVEFLVSDFKNKEKDKDYQGSYNTDVYRVITKGAEFDSEVNDAIISGHNVDIKEIWAYWPTVHGYGVDLRIGNDDRNYSWVKIIILENNQIYKIKAGVSDGMGDGADEEVNTKMELVYKDRCETLVEVVGYQGDTKPYLSRYNNDNWFTPTGYGKNLSGNPMWSTMLLPYGGFKQPAEPHLMPDKWPTSQVPLSVFNGGNFGGYSGLPLSGTPKKAVCVTGALTKFGTTCSTSSECSATDQNAFVFSKDGVCAGIGEKYCYNNMQITNGKMCSTDNDCSSGYTCKEIKYDPNNLNNVHLNKDLTSAFTDLQKLFVEIKSVWKWDRENGKYKLCDVDEGGSLTDCELNTKLDNSSSSENKPVIQDAKLSTLAVPAEGGKVGLEFFAKIDPNQLPLIKINITWGDGKTNEYEGVFAGGNQKFYHFYNCKTDGSGKKCLECFGDVPLANGICNYPVNIKIEDNWELSGEKKVGTVSVGK